MARLLLVDDDTDQVEIRRLLMEAAGHQVAVAGDAETALAEFGRWQPAIVIMDLRLPRTEDGRQLIRALRLASPGVHLILLSGWPGNLGELPETGMVDRVLRKPVRSQSLLNLIDRLA